MEIKKHEKRDKNLTIGLILLICLLIICDKINESNRDLKNHQEKMKLIDKISVVQYIPQEQLEEPECLAPYNEYADVQDNYFGSFKKN